MHRQIWVVETISKGGTEFKVFDSRKLAEQLMEAEREAGNKSFCWDLMAQG